MTSASSSLSAKDQQILQIVFDVESSSKVAAEFFLKNRLAILDMGVRHRLTASLSRFDLFLLRQIKTPLFSLTVLLLSLLTGRVMVGIRSGTLSLLQITELHGYGMDIVFGWLGYVTTEILNRIYLPQLVSRYFSLLRQMMPAGQMKPNPQVVSKLTVGQKNHKNGDVLTYLICLAVLVFLFKTYVQ